MSNFRGINYIGIGGEYPMGCKSGSLALLTGKQAIDASITQILGIEQGSLPFNPYFGSLLYKLIGEPSDEITLSLGRTYIAQALGRWEQRIDILDIDGELKRADALVLFSITYRIRGRNDVNTFVFPFYREAGGLQW